MACGEFVCMTEGDATPMAKGGPPHPSTLASPRCSLNLPPAPARRSTHE